MKEDIYTTTYYKDCDISKEDYFRYSYKNESNIFLPYYPIKLWATIHIQEDPRYIVKRAGAKIYCLEYVNKGYGWLECNGVKERISPGDVYILYPQSETKITADPNNPFDTYSVHFFSDIFLKLLESLNLEYIHIIHNVDCLDIFKEIHNMKSISQYSEDLAFIAYSLVSKALVKCSETLLNSGIDIPITAIQAKREIDQALPKMIDLDTLSTKVNISKSQLNRLFNKYFKTTPYKYQINAIMNLIELDLIKTSKSLDELAYKYGYFDSYALSKAFKKYKGMSPKKFRKETNFLN